MLGYTHVKGGEKKADIVEGPSLDQADTLNVNEYLGAFADFDDIGETKTLLRRRDIVVMQGVMRPENLYQRHQKTGGPVLSVITH